MKKIPFILGFILILLSFSFAETTSSFSFYIIFGNKVETGIKGNLNYYYSEEDWSFLKIRSNIYPINIKINDQNFLLYSDEQRIVVKPGRIKISYNNNSFYYQAEKGLNDISLVKNIHLEPKIKIEDYTDLVSPNGDWVNDKLKIELNSNTYAKMEVSISGENYYKEIYPGDNKLYFNFESIPNGDYKLNIQIYNDKGVYKKNQNITVDRKQKSYGREILFGFIAVFTGIIIWNSIE
ncbi:MAG: hypothetical protein ACQESN_06665 [Thermotogota bacterium]